MSTRSHEQSPEMALHAVAGFDGPLLIDLDETLYLRNSTEDFLDCARPALLAALLLRLLDLFAPWRWSGGPDTRDLWRVRLIRWVLPWTCRRWSRQVQTLAAAYGNRALINALHARAEPPLIVTNGFEPIVRPLLQALGFGHARLTAARLSHADDRRLGKLAMAQARLGEPTIAAALVLSDSHQDQPLLDACARPLLTRWPDARYKPALSSTYLPGQYLARIKRPGERYLLRGILQEDFAFWVLASLPLAAQPLPHLLGLSALLVSFWAIYERGYVDNDQCAHRYEAKPKLSAAFTQETVATPVLLPWLWASLCGALAIVLLRLPATPTAADFISWAGVLLATHLWFRCYNRLDKHSRVWLFAGLQLARASAFAVLLPISLIGAIALAAHVCARWMAYFVYRYGGRDWPDAPFMLVRLLLFVILTVVLSLVTGVASLLNYSTLALLAWNLFRARKELRGALARVQRIDRSTACD